MVVPEVMGKREHPATVGSAWRANGLFGDIDDSSSISAKARSSTKFFLVKIKEYNTHPIVQ